MFLWFYFGVFVAVVQGTARQSVLSQKVNMCFVTTLYSQYCLLTLITL